MRQLGSSRAVACHVSFISNYKVIYKLKWLLFVAFNLLLILNLEIQSDWWSFTLFWLEENDLRVAERLPRLLVAAQKLQISCGLAYCFLSNLLLFTAS